jgi:hypothetical protein
MGSGRDAHERGEAVAPSPTATDHRKNRSQRFLSLASGYSKKVLRPNSEIIWPSRCKGLHLFERIRIFLGL